MEQSCHRRKARAFGRKIETGYLPQLPRELLQNLLDRGRTATDYVTADDAASGSDSGDSILTLELIPAPFLPDDILAADHHRPVRSKICATGNERGARDRCSS